jgi:adenylate cyclase
MTAMFTDVKGFSTISEKLDPTELVRLLNHYLTAMSDIILDLNGTIDKYEGDAIICFFGAPVPMEDHAERACEAAVRMSKVEKEFNEKYIREGLAPSPLLTRIGINSGEMVVGNMGTERKMDYTIMGNSVNLAARLEGVNKQYGTWILISGNTYDNGGSKFLTRRLDRVRVVGIHEPVRLYQVAGGKSPPREIIEGVELFHRGLDLFEGREWFEANKLFKKVLELLPEDGPAMKYAQRCSEYMDNPPKTSWDGVYNLTEK